MFALIFRGFVICSVVGWYSSSLWKVIDGLFKDQFQRYLEAEYRRNPKMRDDVRAYAAVDKPGNGIADPADPAQQRLLEACGLGDGMSCSAVDALAAKQEESVPAPGFDLDERRTGAAAETEEEKRRGKEVVGLVDAEELAFQQSRRSNGHAREPALDQREHGSLEAIKSNAAVQRSETNQSAQSEDESSEPGQLSNLESESENDLDHNFAQRRIGRPERDLSPAPTTKPNNDEEEEVEAAEAGERPKPIEKPSGKKRRTKSAPLIGARRPEEATAQRNGPLFAPRKRRNDNNEQEEEEEGEEDYGDYDRDFSEFDEEQSSASEEAAAGSVAVGELPYRPAVDIYDLDRLSNEEFCPLTADDDPTCDEARGWP